MRCFIVYILRASLRTKKHSPLPQFRVTLPLAPLERKILRTYALLRVALSLAFVALAPTLRAQFQNATPEELKMTADPAAPGAAAVYLNVVQTASNPLHFESTYARIKILTEKGESLATVELPYQKDQYQYNVTDIRGRTIHPDGTIVELTGKPTDLLVAKDRDTKIGRKVFTLPSVEVGSIIEYYYQLRYSDDWYFPPSWQIQGPYFIHKAHYVFTPFPNNESLTYWTVLPPDVKVNNDIQGRYTLDMSDVPAEPSEEWMPPIASSLYRVEFYFRDSSNVNDFWLRQGNSWSKSVEQFTDPSKSLREAVSGLIAPGDSDLDKAKKLYKAVQALDNTDFSREKSNAERKELKLKSVKRAEDVWAEKSGTRTEIALLYLSMLRAAGLTGYAMRVVDRDRGIFAPGYMYFDQLDDTIVLLSIDGKEIPLDPGEKMCPFQTVNWRHSMATGVRQTAGGSAIASTPHQPYTANTFQRVADITLDSHGAIDGNIRFILSGQLALFWRQKAIENDEAEVKKQFDTWMTAVIPDGVEAHVDHFISLDDPDSSLAAVISAHGNLGTATSKRLLVPGFFFETHGAHPFVDQEKRLTPVDMHYGELVNDDVTYNLPAGVAVESAPDAGKVPWEGHAVLIIKSKSDPGAVTVTRTLARSFTIAPTGDYQALRDFYQKVATADQQQLVLTAAPVAKGN
jgi:hypothetical protein